MGGPIHPWGFLVLFPGTEWFGSLFKSTHWHYKWLRETRSLDPRHPPFYSFYIRTVSAPSGSARGHPTVASRSFASTGARQSPVHAPPGRPAGAERWRSLPWSLGEQSRASQPRIWQAGSMPTTPCLQTRPPRPLPRPLGTKTLTVKKTRGT